jgi:hypothetical protein
MIRLRAVRRTWRNPMRNVVIPLRPVTWMRRVPAVWRWRMHARVVIDDVRHHVLVRVIWPWPRPCTSSLPLVEEMLIILQDNPAFFWKIL